MSINKREVGMRNCYTYNYKKDVHVVNTEKSITVFREIVQCV